MLGNVNFNKMDNKEIADEINKDIRNGVYNSFPKLKERMLFIAHKLVLSLYVNNKELSENELNTLRENDYIA